MGICTALIKAEDEIGAVVLVRLRLEVQAGFPDLDWHCQDVQVKHSAGDSAVMVFPCYKWIRTADGNIELRSETVTNLRYTTGFTERTASWSNLQDLEIFSLFNGRGNKIANYVQAHWQEDVFFGHQCLNGCNTLNIRQIHNLPPNLSVTPEMVKPFIPDDSSLQQEMEKGFLYLLDYEVLDELPANIINGKQTYLSAPICLLHYNNQPKMWVRNADFHIHQIVSHLFRTHLFGEVCCIATLRQLPEIHPLHQLLMPHIRSTLQINIQARATLLAPKGVFDKSVACGLEAIPLLLSRATQSLRYSSMCVPDDIRERGLDVLPICYYAQDARRVWDALQRFVAGWICLYYNKDEDVQQDCELQNWIGEIFTEGFLGLTETGLPQSLQSTDEMSKFVTMIIFSSSALHSAVNFSQLDFNLCIPNTPPSMAHPPSQSKGSLSEKDLFSFLPEVSSSCHVLSVLALLSQPAIDFVPLCHYSEWYFKGDAIAKLVVEVQKELKMIVKDIADRNSQLELPYPYLSPDYIENSVAI
ncbi:hypothetical protein DNTS_010909 [Danionella cerebrum]|uniref:Lipoxygenase domain-containing protein n=1 Tax=Danionella cerebrum TaxID=2873325 RepID=A0A553PEB0_9TELE|nr:hypothetical protein DNTS_010909 [Danionella translucida]